MKIINRILIFCTIILLPVLLFFSCNNYENLDTNAIINHLASGDRDDDDDDDDRRIRRCDDRDSCQDSCDYMFVSSRARSSCYDLDLEDVNNLEEVFDDLSSNSVTKNDLEDIDSDDLEFFLELGIDGWTDIINGNRNSGRDKIREAYSSNEAEETLEWIAENEDIADNIFDLDEDDSDIFYNLFKQLGQNSDFNEVSFTIHEGRSNVKTGVTWDLAQILLQKHSGSESSSISLSDTDEFFEFLMGFMGIIEGSGDEVRTPYFGGESYIRFADGERNSSALELAHLSLVRACSDAVDEDVDDEEVKQCLHATYCSIRAIDIDTGAGRFAGWDKRTLSSSEDGIFGFLDDISIISRADYSGCEYDRISDGDKIERYY